MLRLRKSVGRKVAALLVPGSFVLGTSCVENIRESVVSGSLAFFEDSATAVLESVVPLDELLGGGE